MSPSPLPGVSPLVTITKSSSQSSIHHQQSQHNLPIPSTSYNLTPPLNNIPKLSNTIKQQQNLILNSPKMIVQNDKNLDISDSSSVGSNINKISNIPDITAKENSSLEEESISLNSSNNNNNNIINNNNNNNNNNNDELNNDKNQLNSDIKIKKENDKKNSSDTITTINDNNDKQNDKNEKSNNNKKDDEKSIIKFDVSKKREIFLKNLNKHIICNLCQGYLIDATTIVECLHSFCHSCIMKHLRTEQYCPRCEMMINTAKPNIKPDTTLQAIVYKIVPGLYEKELMRKRAFYRDRPKDAAIATPEQRGEDTEHLIFSPTENMSLSLAYADLKEIPTSSDDIYGLNTPKYLQCPASLTVAHLKKFVLMKFAIDSDLFMVEIMYKVKTIVLYDHYTLMDVAYIYTWKRDAPMRFFFRVKETDNYAIKLEKLKRRNPVNKNEININNNSITLPTSISLPTKNNVNCNSTTTNDDTKHQNFEKSKIKIEPQENNKLAYDMNKKFEIVQSPKSINNSETQKTEKIKITLVGKNKYPKITSPNNQDKLIKNDLILSKSIQQQKPIKSIKNSELIYNQKITTNNNHSSNNGEQQPERKPENIKMKIDISKQDSIKIINMSGPDSMPKEIVKSVKPEKEWKIKIKKEDKHSLTNPKTSPKDSDNKRQRKNNLSPLTVPPITIKAEKLSPVQKSYIKSLSPSSSKSKDKNSSSSSSSNNNSSSSKIIIGEKDEEEKKSEFLNSFALTPIKNVSPEKYIKNRINNLPEIKVVPTKNLMGPPLKPVAVSKRKTKEPIKSTNSKKPKFDFADILTPENFTKKRIDKEQQIVKQQPKEMISFGLSPYPIGGNNSNTNNNSNNNNNPNSNTTTNTNNCDVLINGKPLHKFNNDDKLMPAPPPLKALDATKKNGIKKPQNNDINKNIKFPMTTNKQNNKLLQNNRNQHHIAQPGSTTPHPMIPSGIASSKAAMASAPGNRTPIASKRYPSILPKHQSIINPFANIPNEVNKILQDSGTEIKHITPNEDGSNSIKVYGPSMNIPSGSTQKLPINQSQQIPITNNINKNTTINKTSINNQSYLNYALYNASKTRGNEVPPGCRTPMYTPNSPIYSPNSPQYIPNYNIPIQPTYKYAPKSPATTNVNSYLQNVLGQNKQMSGLFPGPPVKKSDDNNMIIKKSVSPPTATPTNINNNFETDMNKLNQNENNNNNKLNYPPFSKTPPNNEKTNKNEPEKQIKVKSLLNSCNINIPSSLSITITNEDSDSKLNNSLNPKHKSPVNNYIEILKLPDQTLQEQINEQQQQQQQQQQNKVKDETTPTKKKDNELPNISSTTSNNTKRNSSGNTKTVMTMNTPRSSPMPFINSTTKTTTSPTTNICTPTSTTSPIITTNKLNPFEKKLTEQPKKSPIETSPKEINKSIGNSKIGQNLDKNNTINKKSPDKKSPSPINDNKKRPNTDKKSSPENGQKTIKTDIIQQQPPTKKFRHILPRAPITTQSQNITNSNKQNLQSSSTNLTKPNTKNLLIQQQQQHQVSQQNQKPSQNIVGGIRTNFPNSSNGCIIGVKTNQQIPTTKNNNSKKNDGGNFLNSLMKSPINSAQQQQQQSSQSSQQSLNLNNNLIEQNVSSSSNNNQRPNSNDMANFLNETILRAAAVNAANAAAVNNSNNSGPSQSNTSSNIFLPHLAAAAAANFGQFAPINFNPYNFQQAIVLEQYARYKAGQDALEKFAQNLKNNNNTNTNKNNSNSPKASILNGNNSNNNAVSDAVTGSTGTK